MALLYEIFKNEQTALQEGQSQNANRIAGSHRFSLISKLKRVAKPSFGRLNMSKVKSVITILAASLISLSVFATDPVRPNSTLTPRAVFAGVTVEQICKPGYANGSDVSNTGHGVRYVPRSVKWAVFKAYLGKVPDKTGNYEVDHLISLELGGSNVQKNLWPESCLTDPYNAHVKDKLENRMHALVRKCLKEKGHAAATALLKQFQHEISTDWVAAYHKYVSSTP